MEIQWQRRTALTGVAEVVGPTGSGRRQAHRESALRAGRWRAEARPQLPRAAEARRVVRSSGRNEVARLEAAGPARSSGLGRTAWTAFALLFVLALALAASGKVRTDNGAGARSGNAVDELPASEGLGGARLPVDPDEPGRRTGETAYF